MVPGETDIRDEIDSLVSLIESLNQQNRRLEIEKRDFDRQPNVGHASYWGEKQTLSALAQRDGIVEAIKASCVWLARQPLPYNDTWPVRKIVQCLGENDEGIEALLTHWPTLRGELEQLVADDLPLHKPEPAAQPTTGSSATDLIRFDEIRRLLGVELKTVQNAASKWRKAGHKINDPDSYATLRPLLLTKWPKKAALFPELYADLQRVLDTCK